MRIANIEDLINDLADGDWRYRQGPDRAARMDGTIEQLHVAIRYLELALPQAEPSLQPLRDLLDDLIDLHEGRKPQRLRPISRTGQPPTKINETRQRGRKAALMELLVVAGCKEEEAASEAARIPPAAKATQVEYWRRRAREGDDKALSIVFKRAVETWLMRHQGDPQRAAKALKDAFNHK